MRHLQPILLLIFMLFVFSVQSQTKNIRLIVRGDDMGFSHAGNVGIIKAYKEGIEQSIEVIVPSPWFPEAVRLLEQNPGVDVGIHLVLTSEWENIKWRPLTDCKSLTDDDGYFYPMIWTNKDYPGKNLLAHNWKLTDIEKEWRAQIELAMKKIPRLSHISGHMGCTNISDSVYALSRKLAKEYHIDIEPKEHNVVEANYDGAHTSSKEKIKSFINMLNKLEAGSTYLFVDHPAIDTPELQAIEHIGYNTVAADRQGVTDAWTNKKVKDTIRKRHIQLISYKDLVQ